MSVLVKNRRQLRKWQTKKKHSIPLNPLKTVLKAQCRAYSFLRFYFSFFFFIVKLWVFTGMFLHLTENIFKALFLPDVHDTQQNAAFGSCKVPHFHRDNLLLKAFHGGHIVIIYDISRFARCVVLRKTRLFCCIVVYSCDRF